MDSNDYGVFANLVAIACSLAATFSVLLARTIGKVNNWTWLVDSTPSFLITAGGRIITLAAMAFTYISINSKNYHFFGYAAIAFGFLGFLLIIRFDYLRRQNIHRIPVVGANGQQAIDSKGQPLFDNVIVGTIKNMNPNARKDYRTAQKSTPGLSIEKWMSGYGAHGDVNNPLNIWSKTTISKIGNEMSYILMLILLSSVMAIFIASFIIEIHSRP